MSDAISPIPLSAAHLGGTTHLHRPVSHDNPFSRPTTPSGRHEAQQIGFLGLGAMGHFMARNLATNNQSHPTGSPPLIVYNRTVSKAEALVKEVGEHRARIAQSPGELATECDVIITNLASDEVVRDIYKQFAAALQVSMSMALLARLGC
jgi:ornithine cyclodeaminase/alanine dehydrogenase-like protein (mu-crystallin family)